MSYFDTVLNVQVSATARSIRQKGFGKPMFLALHSYWTDLYKEFGETSELTTAGVPSSHPIFLWAQELKAQEPSPPVFGIGRRTRAYTQVMTLVPVTPELGKVYSLDIDGHTASYTADADDDVDDVCVALISAINALNITPSDVTAAGVGTVGAYTALTSTAAAGVLHSYVNLMNLSIKDTTANPGSGGVASDFADVLAQNDSFYAVCLDSQSKAEIEALAPAVEAAKKELFVTSADTEILDANVTSDVASDLKTAGYARMTITYHSKPLQYFAAGILGLQLPKQPGSTNFAWKNTLAGVDYMTLKTADYAALDGKNCNHYSDFANQGFGVFLFGVTPGGQFIDITNFSDWMKARMQERLMVLFLNAEKVGQTSVGIDLIANEMRGQFADGVAVGGLDPDFQTVLDIPTIDSIPTADLLARKASGFRARHRLASAFNKVDPMIFTLTV